MTSGYLLDTVICIHFFKNEHGIADKMRIIGRKNYFISEITMAELAFGVENSHIDFRESNRQNLALFAQFMSTSILGIHDAIPIYAREKARLRQLGLIIPDFDLLIGATALAANLTLVTRNTKHFERIEGLPVENWIN